MDNASSRSAILSIDDKRVTSLCTFVIPYDKWGTVAAVLTILLDRLLGNVDYVFHRSLSS